MFIGRPWRHYLELPNASFHAQVGRLQLAWIAQQPERARPRKSARMCRAFEVRERARLLGSRAESFVKRKCKPEAWRLRRGTREVGLQALITASCARARSAVRANCPHRQAGGCAGARLCACPAGFRATSAGTEARGRALLRLLLRPASQAAAAMWYKRRRRTGETCGSREPKPAVNEGVGCDAKPLSLPRKRAAAQPVLLVTRARAVAM